MRYITLKEKRRADQDYLDMIRSGVGRKVANYKHRKAMEEIDRAIEEIVDSTTAI